VETYKIANLPFKLLKIGAGTPEERKPDRKDKPPQGELKISPKV
jgi:hypothetical protein